MKIIRNGNINTYTNTCPICSCYYEYDDADVNVGYEFTSTGRYGYVTCPCCHNINRVSYKFKDDFTYPYYSPMARYDVIDCCSNQATEYEEYNYKAEEDDE